MNDVASHAIWFFIFIFPVVFLINESYKPPKWYNKCEIEFASKYGISFDEYEHYKDYRFSIIADLVIMVSALLFNAFTSVFSYRIVYIIYIIAYIVKISISGVDSIYLPDGNSPLSAYNKALLHTIHEQYDKTFFENGLYFRRESVSKEDLSHFTTLFDKCNEYKSYCKTKYAYSMISAISFLLVVFVLCH